MPSEIQSPQHFLEVLHRTCNSAIPNPVQYAQHLAKPFLSPFVTPQLQGVALPAVGGNHEAMNYLWELYYGGWVAPNIYYLGHAGVVKFGGIRIGGMSGIFNGGHYKQVTCACLGNKVQGICKFCFAAVQLAAPDRQLLSFWYSGSCSKSSHCQCPRSFHSEVVHCHTTVILHGIQCLYHLHNKQQQSFGHKKCQEQHQVCAVIPTGSLGKATIRQQQHAQCIPHQGARCLQAASDSQTPGCVSVT